jgi:flagellar basal-body rod modification protein FlgD
MSTSPVAPTPPTGGTTPTTTNGLPSGQSLNNMFLQLLVAQLQNQDPTSPVDPSQFVGQLAQFSELSEVTSIYQLLQQVVPASGSSGSGGGTTPPASGGSSGGTGTIPPVTGATSALAPSAVAPTSLMTFPPAAATLPSFASPALSALTSKIQGVF